MSARTEQRGAIAAPRIALALAAIAVLAWVIHALRPDPLPVETARVEVGPMQVTIDEDGEVRAHDRYVVSAPVAGRLVRIALHEGDRVAAGQVVARLAPVPLSERERQEQVARVAATQAQLREAEENLARARAGLAQARRERERVERLVADAFVSPQAAEQARLTESSRAEEADAARFRVEAARAEVQAARAGLIAIGKASAVDVRAPAGGSVLRIAEKSERVVAAGAPLLTLGDPGRYEVVLDLLSVDAVKVAPGMPVLLENWGGPGALRARVRVVEPAAFTKVSALGVEEQRVNVVADFVDPPGRLGDGYRVDGRVVVWEAADVLKLPVSSLFRHAEGWAVFAVDGGKARLVPVKIGQRNAREAQLLEGLPRGARVVRHPGNALSDGVPVRADR